MEKQILSIDFDIIMHPCIQLYNDEVDGDDDPKTLWGYLEKKYQYTDNNVLNYDSNLLIELVKLIAFHKKNTEICFITDHHEIIDILKQSSTYKDDTFNIDNIDFHHDLWYRETDFKDILKKDEYNCATWLGYLFLKKKLTSLTWFNTENSVLLEIKPYGSKIKLNIINARNLSSLYNKKFDVIFVCLSPQWIPPQYRFLYDMIQILV